MEDNKRALLHATRPDFPGIIAGDRGAWKKLTGIEDFIRNLMTADIDVEVEDEEIHRVISGIPSPWARPILFKYALQFDPISTPTPVGLAKYFQSVQDEWKGLLGCLALHHDKISTEKILLNRSNENLENSDFDFFEVKGAMGDMLLEDRIFWTTPQIKGEDTPFLQAIYFHSRFEDEMEDKILIGATSPYTVFFTPPNLPAQVEFYDANKGRFINPLKRNLNEQQLQAIYDYARYISTHIEEFQGYFKTKDTKLDLGLIVGFIDRFRREIMEYAKNNRAGGKLKIKARNLFSTNTNFAAPFDTLLNAKAEVYMDQDGKFWIDDETGKNRQLVVLNELMMDPRNELLQVKFGTHEAPERSASYLLKAGDFHYALPLSPMGLKIFQKTLEKMVNGIPSEDSSLTAQTTQWGSAEIAVTLSLKVYLDEIGTESEIYPTHKTYKTRDLPRNEKVIAWPNFISEIGLWEHYYLYSELPHNSNGEFRAFPLLWDVEKKSILERPEVKGGGFEYAFYPYDQKEKRKEATAENGAAKTRDFARDKYEVLIPQTDQAKDQLNYEIYRSKIPFYGIELRLGASDQPKLAGYLIGRIRSFDQYSFSYHDLNIPMEPVTIGFDFGSNNTCVCYSLDGNNKPPELVKFTNRRRVLLGSDNADIEHKLDAKPHELFFFQKEEPQGKIRSMMTIHHDQRLKDPKIDVANAVMGGFPIFEKNLPVRKPGENGIHDYSLELKGGKSTIKYNMKWAGVSQQKENNFKQGFIQTLWLAINAELFHYSNFPKKIVWAYPAAFSNSLLTNYIQMWRMVEPVIPASEEIGIKEKIQLEHWTESHAVANFVSNSKLGKFAPSKDELTLGFDIGGSTTDILILTMKDGKNHLIRQSSVLLAAEPISRAAKSSPEVREALIDICLGMKNVNIFGISRQEGENRMNTENAAYYMNTIFDRLNEKNTEDLYLGLYNREDKKLFSIASFISGVLLYYAGQLVADVLQEPDFSHIRKINLGFYGKGGNIFNWAITVQETGGAASQFYRRCLLGGLLGPQGHSQQNEENIPSFSEKDFTINSTYKTHFTTNKTEVAFGLAEPDGITQPPNNYNQICIIGEEGYLFKGETVPWDFKLSNANMLHLDANHPEAIGIPSSFPRMEHFIGILSEFIKRFDGPSGENLKHGIKHRMGAFRDFIQREIDPYVEAAKKQEDFDFVASLFMLQALYILEKIIMEQE